MNKFENSEQNFDINDDYISIYDIVKFFKTSWKSIFMSGLFFGVFGSLYAYITPPKYEASANIQVTKVANVEIELPLILSEKLKFPSYYSDATLIACKIENIIEPRSFLVERLKPTLIRNTSIISFSFRAKSAEIAKDCLESVLKDIRSNQAELAKPIIEIRKNELENNKVKLEELEQNLKLVFSSKNMNFDFSDAKFSASALLFSTLLSKESEAKDMRALIRDLEISLSEPQTKLAHFIAPIYSSGLVVEPKRFLIISASVMVGFLVMAAYLLLKRNWFEKLQ